MAPTPPSEELQDDDGPPPANATRPGEPEVLNEVVVALSKEIRVDDSTEQLLLFLLAQSILTLDLSSVRWRELATELGLRLLASFLARQIMIFGMHALHAGGALPFHT